MSTIANIPSFARDLLEQGDDPEIYHRTAVDRPSLLETVAAAGLDMPTTRIYNQLSRIGIQPDPDFKLTAEHVRIFGKGVDRDLWPMFEDATSFEHLQAIGQDAWARSEARRVLSESGFSGTALSLVAGLTDPVTLAATVATGGLGATVKLGSAGGRLAQMTKAGLIGAVPFTALETYRVSQDPSADASDVAVAAISGAAQGMGAAVSAPFRMAARIGIEGASAGVGEAIGRYAQATIDPHLDKPVDDFLYGVALQTGLGGIGGVFDAKVKEINGNIRRDIEFANAVESGQPLTPRGEQVYAKQITGEDTKASLATLNEQAKASRAEMDAVLAKEATRIEGVESVRAAKAIAESAPEGAMGAAAAAEFRSPPAPVRKREIGDFNFEGISDAAATGHYTKAVRVGQGVFKFTTDPFDAIAFVASGEKPIQRLANIIFDDALPKADGVAVTSAQTQKRNAVNTFESEMLRANDEAMEAIAKGSKELGFAKVPARDAVMQEAARFLRRDDRVKPADPALSKSVAAMRKVMSDVWAFAARHDERLPESPPATAYLTRRPVASKIDAVVSSRTSGNGTKNGEVTLLDLLTGALRAGTPDLDPKKALEWAKLWHHGFTRFTDRPNVQLYNLFDAENRTLLVEILKDARPDIDDVRIQEIIRELDEVNGEVLPPNARRRMTFDETHKIDTDQGTLAFEDLLDNNAESIVINYIREMVSHSAISEIGRMFSTPDIQGPEGVIKGKRLTTIPEIMHEVKKQIEDRGVPKGKTAGQLLTRSATIKSDLELINTAIHQLGNRGQRTGSVGLRAAAKTINAVNSFRVMSHVRSAINNIIPLGELVGEEGWRVVTHAIPALNDTIGQFKTGKVSSQTLREMEAIGIGLDSFTHRITPGVGDDIDGLDAGRVTSLAQRGARFSYRASGQHFIDRLVHNVAFRAHNQRLLDIATGKAAMPSLERLGDIGYTPATFEQVASELRANATVKDGVFVAANAHKWDDAEAASIYRTNMMGAIKKLAYQGLSPEASAPWMNSTIGSMFVSLRRYGFGAYRSKLIRNVKLGDARAAATLLYGVAFSGLVTAFNTYLASLGKENAQEYRDKMLSPGRLAAGAVSRFSWSSYFPAIADSALGAMDQEPAFSPYRTSGLGGGVFAGTPTGSLISDLKTIAYDDLDSIVNDEPFWNKQRLRAIRSVLIPRLTGIHEILEPLIRSAPERVN